MPSSLPFPSSPLLLLVLALLSSSLLDLAASDCVWHGECGYNPDNGKGLNCFYNGTASEEDGDGEKDIPTNVGIANMGAHSPSGATLVLVSDGEGVDTWVASKDFISLIYRLCSVSTPGAVGRIVREKKSLRATHH